MALGSWEVISKPPDALSVKSIFAYLGPWATPEKVGVLGQVIVAQPPEGLKTEAGYLF